MLTKMLPLVRKEQVGKTFTKKAMKKCQNACSGREGGGWRCYLTRPIKMNVFSGRSSVHDAGAGDDILWHDQLYNDIWNIWPAVLVFPYIRHMR